MKSREWGMGNGEWEVAPISDSPFPTPHSLTFMSNPGDKDIAAEYLALKAALDEICAEISRELSDRNNPPLQVGRQEWRFKVEDSTMVGERFGARYREKTLIVEAGWPREPQDRFVPGRGLARARIGLSQNVMLEAKIVAEMILKRRNNGDPGWNFIADKKLGVEVTESRLREYFNPILVD